MLQDRSSFTLLFFSDTYTGKKFVTVRYRGRHPFSPVGAVRKFAEIFNCIPRHIGYYVLTADEENLRNFLVGLNCKGEDILSNEISVGGLYLVVCPQRSRTGEETLVPDEKTFF